MIKLGYEIKTGKEVGIKPSHLIVTGITQLSGKTTTEKTLYHWTKKVGLKAKRLSPIDFQGQGIYVSNIPKKWEGVIAYDYNSDVICFAVNIKGLKVKKLRDDIGGQVFLLPTLKMETTEEENIRNAYEKGRQEAQKDEIKFLEKVKKESLIKVNKEKIKSEVLDEVVENKKWELKSPAIRRLVLLASISGAGK